MKVASILRTKGGGVVTAPPDTPVMTIVDTLKKEGIGAIVIAAPGGNVTGILSERDLVRALADYGARLMDMRADELMTRDVVTCTAGQHIDEVMKLMTEGRFRHLPVMDGEELIGVISIGDVVKNRLGELEAEARELKSYIATG